MNVYEYNKTPKGKEQLEEVKKLHAQIDAILDDVRMATDETSFGAFIDWDDSGFFEDNDI